MFEVWLAYVIVAFTMSLLTIVFWRRLQRKKYNDRSNETD